MGRCPEPATRDAARPLGASVALRESPECRERRVTSDRPLFRASEASEGTGQGAARGSSSSDTDSPPIILTDGGLAKSDYTSLSQTTAIAPSIQQTGQGYNYIRCQALGTDDTVYVHQLCAIASGEDPHHVFSPEYDCHHKLSVPTKWGVSQIDTPENIELVESWKHRVAEVHRSEEFASEVPK